MKIRLPYWHDVRREQDRIATMRFRNKMQCLSYDMACSPLWIDSYDATTTVLCCYRPVIFPMRTALIGSHIICN